MAPSLSKLRLGLAFVGFVSLCSATIVKPQAQASSTDRVAWVVLVDDLHLDFRNTGRLRNLAQTLLSDVVQEGDLVAIRTTGPSVVWTDFSSRRELLPFLRKLTGAGLHPQEIMNSDRQSAASDEVRFRTRVSLSSAAAAVALLGQVAPRRRGLLYISNGHPFDMSTFIEARALAGVAGQNGVKIFAIDGRSLDAAAQPAALADPAWDAYITATRNSLRDLAGQSGGFAILDGGDMPGALQRIIGAIRQ
jgi:hypothetical protein